MEILKDLELVEVEYTNDDKKVTMTFFDSENRSIREVNFNKQAYDVDKKKFVDNAEKDAQVESWCDTYFGVSFDELKDCVGVKKTIYAYDAFSSLWEVAEIKKFTAKDKGQMYPTTIDSVDVSDMFIRVRYTIDGNQYESKQTLGKYMESMKEWFFDSVKAKKEKQKFENKYGVPVERANEIVGMDIFVEVKQCFGDNFYGDIKVAKKK